MGSTKFLLGILTGAAAGAALGILFAREKNPSTARNTPHNNDAASELEKKFDEFINIINLKLKTQQDKPLVRQAVQVAHDGHLNPEKGKAEVDASME